MFHPRSWQRVAWIGVCGALPLAVLAQTSHEHHTQPVAGPASSTGEPGAEARNRWLRANEAVGAFPGGHSDLWRWERAHGMARDPDPEPTPSEPWSLADVVRHAQAQRPDLVIEPGLGQVDAQQREREAAALAVAAQEVWLDAITARAQRGIAQRQLEAAQAGAELAARMREVGNFSAERQQREALAMAQAQATLEQARADEQAALLRAWQLIGGTATPDALGEHLPAALPARTPLPDDDQWPTLLAQARSHHALWPRQAEVAQRLRRALSETEWQSLQAQWHALVTAHSPHAPRWSPQAVRWPQRWTDAWQAHAVLSRLEREIEAELRLALVQARAAAAQAQNLRTQQLPAMQTLLDEATLRYNGMLISTWDLLASVRARLESEQRTLEAERAAWHAWFRLQRVLAGLSPARPCDAPQGACRPSTPIQQEH